MHSNSVHTSQLSNEHVVRSRCCRRSSNVDSRWLRICCSLRHHFRVQTIDQETHNGTLTRPKVEHLRPFHLLNKVTSEIVRKSKYSTFCSRHAAPFFTHCVLGGNSKADHARHVRLPTFESFCSGIEFDFKICEFNAAAAIWMRTAFFQLFRWYARRTVQIKEERVVVRIVQNRLANEPTKTRMQTNVTCY